MHAAWKKVITCLSIDTGCHHVCSRTTSHLTLGYITLFCEIRVNVALRMQVAKLHFWNNQFTMHLSSFFSYTYKKLSVCILLLRYLYYHFVKCVHSETKFSKGFE